LKSAVPSDRLAVDHELAALVLQRGLDDPWIATAPVVAVAGKQAHGLALALNDQAIAVRFDFVERRGRRWDTLVPEVGRQGRNVVRMRPKIGTRGGNCESAP